MIASGIPDRQAVKISRCAGLKGVAARDYVSAHKKDIGEITLQQQESLFSIIYAKYVERAIANYKSGLMAFPVRSTGKLGYIYPRSVG